MDVTLLTRDDCAFCDTAKALLDRLSSEFPLSVRTIDMRSEEGERMAAEGEILFPPAVFLDGTAVSYGRPSERRLRREIERRLQPAGDPGSAA